MAGDSDDRTWAEQDPPDEDVPLWLTLDGAPSDPADAGGETRSVWGPYREEGLLGAGGMGEVYRVRDPTLGRTVALKVARAGLPQARLARFVQEARVTAQLQHPGIVAVHELGRLPDGRRYFTMKEIRGRQLAEVIAEVHASGGRSGDGWTLRRLVDAFRDACEAIAYAHSRGVVHRDLKPANIMVGDYGEVVIVDWGLAKILGQDDPAEITTALEPVTGAEGLGQTQQGLVQGTPAYMSPEQARGDVAALGPGSDVYALGCVLFEILTGGPPFVGASPLRVLRRVLENRREPLEGALPVPEALRGIVDRALSPAVEDRHPDAHALADDVGAWLDGVRRHADALRSVQAADARIPVIADLEARAAALRREAAALLGDVPPHAPVDDKLPGWRKEDQARELERVIVLEQEARVQHLHTALRLEADLPEAHARLADHYRQVHQKAEGLGDHDGAARAEVHLRSHDRGRHAAYLTGLGALTLVTRPEGARVQAWRYVERDRRLVLEPAGPLGRTPLREVSLPAGSYLLVVEAEGRAPLRYPALVPRGGHWHGVPPGATDPAVVPLLAPDDLDDDDCYVPPGWTWVGGDHDAVDPLPLARVWVPGFVVKRCAVTVGAYLAFLQALVANGQVDQALERRPRARNDTAGSESPVQLVAGRLVLGADEHGETWQADWPVVRVSWHDAVAFAATRPGGWRLLHDLEWEKAGRGVDRRRFPWGDHFEPTWARTLNSRAGPPSRAPVGTHPHDEGPCGARDMAGLARDWCLNDYVEPFTFEGEQVVRAVAGTGPYRFTRGGFFQSGESQARLASRLAGAPGGRWTATGFRLARSVPDVP